MNNVLKKIGIAACGVLLVAGCGKDGEKVSGGSEKVELSFVTYSGTGEDFMMELNSISDAYNKVNPNVTIKMEKVPATEYDNTMKIRNSAQKLPDIFPVRVITLENYKNILTPLNDLEATKLNKFAKDYAIDGNIYGLPMYGFNEFVYYRKSIFNELGLEVPTTWEEFNSVTQKLKASGEYIPMALGGKDSWVTYPFNEFFPFLVSGGNDVWSKMAAEDEPFSPGKPFYTAYSMLNEFYKTKPFGDDPLGYGWDQEKNMFISKKAAMLAAGQWFYLDLAKDLSKEDLEDIGVFMIPTRKNKDENFRYLVTAEVFLAIPKYSKHQEEAKEFINWLFTSDYYKEFIKYMQVLPTVDGVEISGDIFSEAVNSIPNPEPVLQKGGNDTYRQISNFISFDVKRMGQEMLQGVDFEKYMAEYNKKWKEARKNIN